MFTSTEEGGVPAFRSYSRKLGLLLAFASLPISMSRAESVDAGAFELRFVSVAGDMSGEIFIFHSAVPGLAVRSRVDRTILLDLRSLEAAHVVRGRKLHGAAAVYDVGLSLTEDGWTSLKGIWEDAERTGRELAIIVSGKLIVKFFPAAIPRQPAFSRGVGALLDYGDAQTFAGELNTAIARMGRPALLKSDVRR